ncbi:arginine--tRNA ligase [Candidatus Mycoplasma pogonae]
MYIKDQIIASLQEALKKNNFPEKNIILTEPKDHGDFSTNLALQLKKDLKLNPLEIAEKIASVINLKKYNIKKIEVVAPGFINFFVNNNVLAQEVNHIIEKADQYGADHQGLKINIEYVSANPTGFLHIGHARGAAIGATLAAILKFAGNHVTEEYYVNDAGKQIDILAISAFVRYQQHFGKDAQLPEDSYGGEDIKWLAIKLAEKFGNQYVEANFEDVKNIFKQEGIKIFLEKINHDLNIFGVNIEKYTSEDSLYKNGAIDHALGALKDTYLQDGATWLKTTLNGDDKDRVLIKSDGSYAYLLPDIANHHQKILANNGQDKLINIWGADHIGYVQRLKFAVEQLGFNANENLDFLICQTVRLMRNGEEFKMSKRKGTAISLISFLDVLGKDAARFFLINRSENSVLDLDVDAVQEKNTKNPVFLVQYSYARTVQLLNKTNQTIFKAENFEEPKAIALINRLKEFPEIIQAITKTYKVHLLPQYLIKLANDFNSFYSNFKIIGNINEQSLLALVKATQIVLAQGLKLIGVDAPERM